MLYLLIHGMSSRRRRLKIDRVHLRQDYFILLFVLLIDLLLFVAVLLAPQKICQVWNGLLRVQVVLFAIAIAALDQAGHVVGLEGGEAAESADSAEEKRVLGLATRSVHLFGVKVICVVGSGGCGGASGGVVVVCIVHVDHRVWLLLEGFDDGCVVELVRLIKIVE